MKNPVFPLVSATWLKDHLDHTNLIVLDATIKQITNKNLIDDSKKIPKARFFDIKESFSDNETSIPNMLVSAKSFEKGCQQLGINQDSQLVIYDQIGIYSSPRVWWMFKIMGFHNVAVLDGGLPHWITKDYPIEAYNSTKTDYKKGNFKALYKPELVVNQKDIFTVMHNPDVAILDARSQGRFCGKEPEPREGLKSGHIPKSLNLPYTSVLEEGKMKSVEELKNIFSNLNLNDKKLIFTCGSGITACIIMLAAQIVGYQNLSIYDGSWSEWGLIEGLPIEC